MEKELHAGPIRCPDRRRLPDPMPPGLVHHLRGRWLLGLLCRIVRHRSGRQALRVGRCLGQVCALRTVCGLRRTRPPRARYQRTTVCSCADALAVGSLAPSVGHAFRGAVAAQVMLVGVKVRAVPADILLIAADVGPVALDITAVSADLRLVAGDIRLLVVARTLLGIFMPQVRLVRTDVPAVMPDVAAVRANVSPVVCNVTLVRRDITPVGSHVRLRGTHGWPGHGLA